MKRVKRRIFSGVVCEQIVYCVRDGADVKTAAPRLRFKNEEERAKHREEISRRHHSRIFNQTFVPGDLYSTLTFDDEHEAHTFDEVRRLARNYLRRLTRACPDAVIFIYMGRGKGTRRIHLHMVSHGVPEDIIRAKWGLGDIDYIVKLRAHCYYEDNGRGNGKTDHGPDFTGLANYLYNHWTPEQGGHRWMATRNMATRKISKPEVEDATECRRDYSADKPPLPPKGYKIVEAKSTPYGYLYFRYVFDPDIPKNDSGG